jgi:hypothetical protein
MEQITQIEVRQDMLIDVLSMAVLNCRGEIHKLDYDAASVLDDVDEYRRLLRIMNVALNIIEAVGDFSSTQFVRISGNGDFYEDGITIDTITRKG